MDSDIRDISLAPQGKGRIDWADREMPVLRAIRERFSKEQPFKGLRFSACLHVTAETANLMRTLQAGGADLFLCASNPLSTQDDVAASLVTDYQIPTFAIKGESRDIFFAHLRKAIEYQPQVTMDDGADLVSTIHKEYPGQAKEIIASMEETTTGVIRLRAMEREGALQIPVLAVNDAKTKNLFDNRYGTGQSTIEAVMRATGKLLAGSSFVVLGYGWCGKGLAMRAKGMGANVIVTEVDPLKALEAAMDGFQVMPILEAAPRGDIFVTVTGDKNAIDGPHLERMKDGAIVANSGHFDVEVNVEYLEKHGQNRPVNKDVKEYIIGGGAPKRIYLLSEGRLVNLAAAEGHPAAVMDMSFATQALAAEWAVKNRGTLPPKVYPVPEEIETYIARLKLAAMGIAIDVLTDEQKKYLAAWEDGT